MADFTIRADAVDVEQIMQRIRARIAEKRGVDYTAAQVRDIAAVPLERFMDARSVRSDLLEHFRGSRPTIDADRAAFGAACAFDEQALFTAERRSTRLVRRLLGPFLRLVYNPLIGVLRSQSHLNVALLTRSAHWNALQYEVMHNLVLETTKMSVEVKNLKMVVQSLSSRLDMSERRARALEGVVQYRPDAVDASSRALPDTAATARADSGAADSPHPDAPSSAPAGGATRARRRRRGR
jgi:hypothetical protein